VGEKVMEMLLLLAGTAFAFLALSLLSPRGRILFGVLSAFLFFTVAVNVGAVPVHTSAGTEWITEGGGYAYLFLSLGFVAVAWSVVAGLDYLMGGRLLGGASEEEE
jgi:hypothetical protein